MCGILGVLHVYLTSILHIPLQYMFYTYISTYVNSCIIGKDFNDRTFLVIISKIRQLVGYTFKFTNCPIYKYLYFILCCFFINVAVNVHLAIILIK